MNGRAYHLPVSDCELNFLLQVIIELKSSLTSEQRFQTICHEMLHLELLLNGYPLIQVLDTDPNGKQLVAHLESLLQHRIIMPIEEKEFGYDPYSSELKVAESTYSRLKGQKNFGSADDCLWRLVYCSWGAAYARALLFCSDTEQLNSLNSLFRADAFSDSAKIADELVKMANKDKLQSADQYIETLRSILITLIGDCNMIDGVERLKLGNPMFS